MVGTSRRGLARTTFLPGRGSSRTPPDFVVQEKQNVALDLSYPKMQRSRKSDDFWGFGSSVDPHGSTTFPGFWLYAAITSTMTL